MAPPSAAASSGVVAGRPGPGELIPLYTILELPLILHVYLLLNTAGAAPVSTVAGDSDSQRDKIGEIYGDDSQLSANYIDDSDLAVPVSPDDPSSYGTY